jgi:3-oxoacyl-[acyl-carrier protein] reductase
MFSLESKVALVTGAGRGIGRAIALRLAAAGAKVMANDLDAAPLEETRAATGGVAMPGDVTDPAFPSLLIERTVAELGGLDIVVNNAGYTWDNVIQKTTDEQFQAMLDIHVVEKPRRGAGCSARSSTSRRFRAPTAPRGRRATRREKPR